MEDTKKWPYCGEEIKAKAKKCRFCGQWLEQTETVVDNITTKADDIAIGTEETIIKTNDTEANSKADRLKELIQAFKNSHQEPSKYVYLWGQIPQDVLDSHIKKYARLDADEEVLIVINKFIFSAPIQTSMVITNKSMHCRLVNDSFFTPFFPKLHYYKYDLSKIDNMSIGQSDHCFGTAYAGHQLIVNDSVLGLLRMGMSITWDDKMINELNFIWKAFNQ